MQHLIALLPFAVAVALLLARRKLGWRSFLLASSVLLFAAWVTSVSCKDWVVYSAEAPFRAAGLASWALVPAAFTLVGVCALPPVSVWRFLQPFVAGYLALLALTLGFWIA